MELQRPCRHNQAAEFACMCGCPDATRGRRKSCDAYDIPSDRWAHTHRTYDNCHGPAARSDPW